MLEGVLQLLPDRGLDQSLHLAVLLGVWCLLLLTESFGWVYAGLVVPGYVASVFIFRPLSGFVTIFEALVTYVVARFLSDRLGPTRVWSSFFGRDRFFAIVVISVLVRIVSEVWFLPLVAVAIRRWTGWTEHFEADSFSVGLVAVALSANMFWKLDVPRGLLQIAVPTLVVYLILRFVLLPSTNLSYSSLELTYEDLARNFAASPKAYIILIFGAYIAAKLNHRYGWDFNGILVPALLAIAWFTPLRVLATVVECLMLVAVMKAFIKLPVVRRWNLEGPRTIAVVYTLGFFVKYAFSWALGDHLPSLKATDLFGFGYLLPSLLAVKMLQKKVVARVLFPSLLASGMAFVGGTAIGYALEQIAPRPAPPERFVLRPPRATRLLTKSVVGMAMMARVRSRRESAHAGTSALLSAPPGYAAFWRDVDGWLASGALDVPKSLATSAAALGYAIDPIRESDARPTVAYAIVEAEERLGRQRGLDTAIVFPGARGPVLEVPRPSAEIPTAGLAAMLCPRVECRAVLLAGIDILSVPVDAATPTIANGSSFDLAHRGLTSAPVIQLRADPSRSAADAVVVHARRGLTSDVALAALWPGKLSLVWDTPPNAPPQWNSDGSFFVLRAHPQVFMDELVRNQPPVEQTAGTSLAIWLDEWFASEIAAGADRGMPRYLAPSESELGFLEEVVASSLFDHGTTLFGGREQRLLYTARMASLVGLGVNVLPACLGTANECWILADLDRPSPLGWGLLVAIQGDANPVIVEAPRPGREPGTWRMAAALLQLAKGRGLVVGGAALAPPEEGDPDATTAGNGATPFQAFHQAAHRGVAGRPGALMVELRGLARNRPSPVSAPLVVGVGRPLLQGRQTTTALHEFLTGNPILAPLMPDSRSADAAADLIGLHGAGIPQIEYCVAIGGADCAVLWLSEDARRPWEGAGKASVETLLGQLNVSFSGRSPRALMAEPPLQASAETVPPELESTLSGLAAIAARYRATENVHLLDEMGVRVRKLKGARLEVGWSSELGVAVGLVELAAGNHVLRALFPLRGQATGRVDIAADATGLSLRLADELYRRQALIVVHGRRSVVRR